jgi:hypothetical protein
MVNFANKPFMLSVIMLSVIMLNVPVLSVVLLNVVAPSKQGLMCIPYPPL